MYELIKCEIKDQSGALRSVTLDGYNMFFNFAQHVSECKAPYLLGDLGTNQYIESANSHGFRLNMHIPVPCTTGDQRKMQLATCESPSG